jgi:hypothetical protein
MQLNWGVGGAFKYARKFEQYTAAPAILDKNHHPKKQRARVWHPQI